MKFYSGEKVILVSYEEARKMYKNGDFTNLNYKLYFSTNDYYIYSLHWEDYKRNFANHEFDVAKKDEDDYYDHLKLICKDEDEDYSYLWIPIFMVKKKQPIKIDDKLFQI